MEPEPKHPIDMLLAEHRAIETVLDCLEEIALAFRQAVVPPEREAREILWFLRNFTDGCHHAKEENLLFPLLEAKGLSSNLGPTAAMRMEHRLGASLIRSMEEGLDKFAAAEEAEAGRKAYVHAAEGYAGLLRSHIRKEDHCVFAMAGHLLESADLETLGEAFRKVDTDFRDADKGAQRDRAEAVLSMAARLSGRDASPSLAFNSRTLEPR